MPQSTLTLAVLSVFFLSILLHCQYLPHWAYAAERHSKIWGLIYQTEHRTSSECVCRNCRHAPRMPHMVNHTLSINIPGLKGNNTIFCFNCSQVLGSTSADVKKVMKSCLWLHRKLRVIWQTASSDVTHWRSCIVGNVGARLWKGSRICGIKKAIFLVLLHRFWSFVFKLSIMSPAYVTHSAL